MNLTLKPKLLEVVEIGYPPQSYLFGGLTSSYHFGESVRKFEHHRLGIITNLCEDAKGLRVGDFVCYNYTRSTQSLFQNHRVLHITEVMGIYSGIVVEGNTYTLDMEKFSFEPFSDRLVVRLEKKEESKSNGLIITPEVEIENYRTGEVVAIGEEVKFLKPADQVLFGKSSGMKLDLVEGEFLLMREAEIYGKIR